MNTVSTPLLVMGVLYVFASLALIIEAASLTTGVFIFAGAVFFIGMTAIILGARIRSHGA